MSAFDHKHGLFSSQEIQKYQEVERQAEQNFPAIAEQLKRFCQQPSSPLDKIGMLVQDFENGRITSFRELNQKATFNLKSTMPQIAQARIQESSQLRVPPNEASQTVMHQIEKLLKEHFPEYITQSEPTSFHPS